MNRIYPAEMKNSSNILLMVLFIAVAFRSTVGNENVVLHNSHVRLTFIEGMPTFKFSTFDVSIADVGVQRVKCTNCNYLF